MLVEPELVDFVSRYFEELCCSALRALYSDYTVRETGQWWYGKHEIDVVGLATSDTLILGEYKFQESPLGADAFSKLRSHADELRWASDDGSERIEQYALFSRSGFKSSVEESAAERDDLRIFTVADIVEAVSARLDHRVSRDQDDARSRRLLD
nr:DUF234 domain-containing protein [Halorussus rarus]